MITKQTQCEATDTMLPVSVWLLRSLWRGRQCLSSRVCLRVALYSCSNSWLRPTDIYLQCSKRTASFSFRCLAL